MSGRRGGGSKLVAVMFTDIVASTNVAREMGDRRWRELLDRHNRLVRHELKRHRGREIDTAGDGFFATFEGPANAIRCAAAATSSVRDLGIEIRVGIHMGEVELTGKQMRGVAVHAGARVMSEAGPGEILVSRTARELVVGSGFEFQDRGPHRLKGLEGEWYLFSVSAVDGTPLAAPADRAEATRRRAQILARPFVRRRRGPLIVAAALCVGAIASVVVLLAGGGEPPRHKAPALFDSTIRFDPRTNRVLASFPRTDPMDVAVGEGGVWARGFGALYHLDPQTGRVLASVPIPAFGGVRIGGHSVWTTGFGEVVRVDPATDEPVATIGTAQGEGGGLTPIGFAISPRSAWTILQTNELAQIDLATNRIVHRFDLGGGLSGVAYGAGSLWISDSLTNEVKRVNPSTGKAVVTIPLAYTPDAITFGNGAVWVLNFQGAIVVEIDPATEQAGTPISVGSTPDDIAVGLGSLWVTSPGAGVLWEIDPVTGSKERHRVGGPVHAIALDEKTRTVWLTVGDVGSPE